LNEKFNANVVISGKDGMPFGRIKIFQIKTDAKSSTMFPAVIDYSVLTEDCSRASLEELPVFRAIFCAGGVVAK